jgi:hypothetical protein
VNFKNVVRRATKKQPAHIDKIPINPRTGEPADTMNPTTWGAYEDAIDGLSRWPVHGLGFVFTKAARVVGADFDNCGDIRTGRISPTVHEVITTLDSYSEWSPSGTGIHVLDYGDPLPAEGRKTTWNGHKVEMYDEGRFFTITGLPVPGTPNVIATRPQENLAVHTRVFGPQPYRAASMSRDQSEARAALPPDSDDTALLVKIFGSKSGDRIRALWEGGAPASGDTSASGGDHALLCALAWWTHGNAAHIERLFRQSSRMELAEPKGQKYLARSIKKAIVAYHHNRPPLPDPPPITSEYIVPPAPRDGTPNGEIIHEKDPAQPAPTEADRWPLLRPADLLTDTDDATLEWIITGLAARYHATNVPGLWKVGKTTFISHAIDAVITGRPFCGLSTTLTRVLIVSEEHKTIWGAERPYATQWPDASVRFILQPFIMARPTPAEWDLFARYLAARVREDAFGLVLMDSIHNLWGVVQENDNAEQLRWLMPLSRITQAGAALILAGHPSKTDQSEGRLSRGGGALSGWVSIIAELRRFDPQDRTSTRRVIDGFSKFQATPHELVIDLIGGAYEAAGTRQEVRTALRRAEAVSRQDTALTCLPLIPPGMTDKELQRAWPGEETPSVKTIRRYLTALWKQRRVQRTGEGKPPDDPFRYWREGSAGETIQENLLGH